ncbi:MAG: hypothetical protein ACON5F_04070 [Jejuia sp.]
MKRIITLILFLFTLMYSEAQTEGISYQAVIIGPDDLELPGVDSEGNYLPTTDITVRFSIIAPGSGIVEFTEQQDTTTDEFGRINLIIGQGNYDDFEKIYWGGNPKSLKVEIDFRDGNGFMDLSVEKLTYVPYVQHRTIKASDSLIVDGNTELRGDLTVVNQPTNLGGTFNVNGGNRSNLSGDLNVDGVTNLNNEFNVNDKSVSNLSGPLNVGDPSIGPPNGDPDAPTTLNGSLSVVGESTFSSLVADNLTINESTELTGTLNVYSENQIQLRSTVHTDAIAYGGTSPMEQVQGVDPGKFIGNYPLLVEGSTQGIAIKVNGNSRNGNNYVSFWDGDGLIRMRGRIEGEVPEEFGNNADWLFDQSSLDFDIYDSEIDLGFAVAHSIIADLQLIKAANDYRVCAGLGTCVAAPSVADLLFSAAEVVSAALQAIFAEQVKFRAEGYLATYDNNKLLFQGVSYASGAGDYAEYLMRENLNEDINFGEIVGMRGGKISKNTSNAQRMMVVSYKPIVLGNMPQSDEEGNYEKVAFMGQVPVKVFGNVEIGDYIIPSGNNDGFGIAIHPSKITLKELNQIVGVAWTKSSKSYGKSSVIVAVGLNNNDSSYIIQNLEAKLNAQANEIANLKGQVDKILKMLSDGGNAKQSKTLIDQHQDDDNHDVVTFDDRKYDIVDTDHGEIVYWEITMEDFEKGMQLAESQMLEKGINIYDDKLWGKLKEDPNYRNNILQNIKSTIDQKFHYHRKVSTSKHN